MWESLCKIFLHRPATPCVWASHLLCAGAGGLSFMQCHTNRDVPSDCAPTYTGERPAHLRQTAPCHFEDFDSIGTRMLGVWGRRLLRRETVLLVYRHSQQPRPLGRAVWTLPETSSLHIHTIFKTTHQGSTCHVEHCIFLMSNEPSTSIWCA